MLNEIKKFFLSVGSIKNNLKNGVVCIGSATKDIFFPTGDGIILETPDDLTSQRKIAFELGAKYHIDERFETLGGCSVNVAAGLSRLGVNVSCYAPIGDDEEGNWILQRISQNNINTSSVNKIPETVSDLSAIIVDSKSGERTIFSNHGASQKFVVEKEKIKNFRWVFVGDLSGDWKSNIDVIFQKAWEVGMKIAFNPRQQMLHSGMLSVLKMISFCDLLFVNKDEAIEIVSEMNGKNKITEIEEERFLLQKLKELGVSIVVLTDGVRGAWVFDGKEMFHCEALLRKAVDTTGSGDAFASGFFGALLKEKSISESLKWGIANSSSSVGFYGGEKGLLYEVEIEKNAQNISAIKITF
ncbi:MAG: hypothetical protein ACD_11C00108G0021 [uncultured bacterium]|nr:MAG: hypothetical protein ACD_11C00108G0021 [uncultured bacterium]HBR71427.1 hypothetical protein [Candidatus Moranbacteria bacterium]